MSKYDDVYILGLLQWLLSGFSICLGIADIAVGAKSNQWEFYPWGPYPGWFRLYMLGAGIWISLLFLIGGCLACTCIYDGRGKECEIGAAKTMAWLNTLLFAPALIGISSAGCKQTYVDLDNVPDTENYYWPFGKHYEVEKMYSELNGLEGALAAAGVLQFLLSVGITYCFWGLPATNQVAPVPTPNRSTTVPAAPRPSPSKGKARRAGTTLSASKPSTSAPSAAPRQGPSIDDASPGTPSTSVPPAASTGGEVKVNISHAVDLDVQYARRAEP